MVVACKLLQDDHEEMHFVHQVGEGDANVHGACTRLRHIHLLDGLPDRRRSLTCGDLDLHLLGER